MVMAGNNFDDIEFGLFFSEKEKEYSMKIMRKNHYRIRSLVGMVRKNKSFYIIITLFFCSNVFYAQNINSREIDSLYTLQKQLYRQYDDEKVLEIGINYHLNPPPRNTYTDSLLYAKIIAKVGDVYTNTFAESYKSFEWHQRALDVLGTDLDEAGTRFKAYVYYAMYYNSNIQSKLLQGEKYANKAIEVVNSYPETTGWILDLKIILACRLSDLNMELGNVSKSNFYLRQAINAFDELMSFTGKRTSKPNENYYVSILVRKIQNITLRLSNTDKYSAKNIEKITLYSKALDSVYNEHYTGKKIMERWGHENQMNIAAGLDEIAKYYYEDKDNFSEEELLFALNQNKKAINILENIELYNRNYVSTKLQYAKILLKLNKFEEALNLVNELTQQIDKKSIRPFQLNFLKGEIWASKKNLDSALYYFHKTAESFQNENILPLKKDLSNYTTGHRFPTETQYFNSIGNTLIKFFPTDTLAKEQAYLFYNTAFKDFNNQFKNQRLNKFLESYLNNQIENNLRLNPLFKDTLDIKNMLSSIENIDNQLAWENFNRSRHIVKLPMLDSLEQFEYQIRKQLVDFKKEQDTKKVDSLAKLLEDHQFNVNSKFPSFANFTQNEFDIEKFQKLIARDEVVLKYIFFEDHFALFQISKEDINYELRPWNDNQKDLLKKHLDHVQNQEHTIEDKNILTEILVPKSALEFNKITIIPDNEVYLLPFETLKYNGEYLIKSHSVRYSSHLRFTYFEDNDQQNSEKRSSIFAPDYPKGNVEYVTRSQPIFLEGAQKEAKYLESVFPSQSFIGEDATKENFVENKSNGDILHLAMHATLDEEDSSLSHFNFANDQKLYLEELYALNIPADLAVLSACNTAIGNEDGALSMASLQRAFTYAGTKATIASLWEVPDESTSQIMISFYEYLKEGENKSLALQKAKIDYLKNTKVEKLRHPYYWAGFVLYGDDSPVLETSSGWIWLILGLVTLMIFIILLKKIKISNR
jgi:CHAT domain-containing protein